MKKLFSKLLALISCLFGKHEWQYLYGNYHSSKDVFKCKNCGRKTEQ